jgi:hypothetical protein
MGTGLLMADMEPVGDERRMSAPEEMAKTYWDRP